MQSRTRKCVRPRPKHCADPFLQAPWRSLSRHFHRTVAATLGGWQTSLSHRSNYALREEVLAFRSDKRMGPTAVVTHGANPGLASALVKQALLNMALQNRLHGRHPSCYEDWAALERRLGVKAIHIAERDTRFAGRRKKRDEFVNTWSVDAFVEEGLQPSKLGWGSHEQPWPDDAKRHGFGCDAAVYLTRPGFSAHVRSWTPLGGPYNGYLITHGESIRSRIVTLREEGESSIGPPLTTPTDPAKTRCCPFMNWPTVTGVWCGP